MTLRRLLPAVLLLLLLPVPLRAQLDLATTACTDQTAAAFAREQRLYRSVVYGSKKAADLPVGSMLYDKQGNAFLKKGANAWAGSGASVRGDSAMDAAKDTPTRRGLLETRRSQTSDLIPALTQSLRAFQCRLQAVCAVGEWSQTAPKDNETLTVQPDGCIELTMPVIDGCRITEDIAPSFMAVGVCDQAAQAVFDREKNTLDLSVAYDASYRSVAQFAGMFDGFLKEFRFPLLTPLWQTVRVLGGLKNIPCFLAQCDQ